MYQNVISLGFFCSVAIELQRIYLRNHSGPFDWTISNLSGVVGLMQHQFEDFLNPIYLKRHPQYPYIIINEKCGISFYHDFSPKLSIAEQLPKIKEKYDRRIDIFYQDIKKPTLFVRYIEDEKELNYIEDHYTMIIQLLKSYNSKNNILWIKNKVIGGKRPSFSYVYEVEKDVGDSVARKFLDKNTTLMRYLGGPIIPQEVKIKNKLWLQNNSRS